MHVLFLSTFGAMPLAAIDPISIVAGVVAGLIVGVIATQVLFKNSAGSALKKSKGEADDLIAKAQRDVADMVKKAETDGRAEYLRIKESAEKEVDSARKEMREQEQRLQKREDILDRKLDTLGIKEKNLENIEKSLTDRKKNIEVKEKELDGTLAQQKDMLLRITGMSVDEARQLLLSRIEHEIRHDTP